MVKKMKLVAKLTMSLTCLGLLTAFNTTVFMQDTPSPEGKKPQDVYELAREGKLGKVTFSHVNHITKNRNLDATGPVACVECHHTAQPASELAKYPPLKTPFPADRTTTLTAELLAKDPKADGGLTCIKCHARAGMKPESWPEIPNIKHETSTAVLTLTNQQAFHRNCAGCHDLVVKSRKDMNPPTSMKCGGCHKK
jgi:cytochrome c553